jgi:hypothetical protein
MAYYIKLKAHYTDLLEICCRLAADRLSSKSTASLQHFATNGFVYNILKCRDVVDKSVVSPAASRQQICAMWFIKLKPHYTDLLEICCV